MILREFTTVSTADEEKIAIKSFIRWTCGALKLDIKKLPHIEFNADQKSAAKDHRTGYFDQQAQKIVVYVGNRNLIDIFRTIAHELAHLKQNQLDLIKSHGPGSGPERSADQVAGYLMKIYGAKHPEIFQ